MLRDRLPDVLDLFDFAEPSLVTGDRETTNVPVQALYLMNSPFVQARAKGLADRVTREADERRRTASAARSSCASAAARTPPRRSWSPRSWSAGRSSPGTTRSSARQLLANCCQALLSAAEFRNLD